MQKRIDDAKASGGASELIRQRMELSTELADLNSKYDASCRNIKSFYQTDYDNACSVLHGLEQQRELTQRKHNTLSQEITIKQQKEASMLKEYKEATKPITVETSCPTCGQMLEPEKINATKAQAQRQQTERVNDIIAKGKAVRAERETIERELESVNEQISALDKAIADKMEKVKEAKLSLDTLPTPPKHERIGEIEKQIADINTQIESAKLTDSTSDLEAELKGIQTKIANADHFRKVQMQISELTEREKELNAIYEECESILFLIEKFVVSKVKLLESRINEKFKYVGFKLFHEQVNGGIAECCEILYDGVPFKDLNTGSRMNAGLDIINTLSVHYGLKTPVFVDNAESLTKFIDVDTQLIKLVVDPNAKTLEVA